MGVAGGKKRKTHSCLHMGRLRYGALPTRAAHWELTAVPPVVPVSSMQALLSPLALANRSTDSGMDTRQARDSLQTVGVESESDCAAANWFHTCVFALMMHRSWMVQTRVGKHFDWWATLGSNM